MWRVCPVIIELSAESSSDTMFQTSSGSPCRGMSWRATTSRIISPGTYSMSAVSIGPGAIVFTVTP